MSNTIDILSSLNGATMSPEFRFWNGIDGAGIMTIAGSMVIRQTYIHRYCLLNGADLSRRLNELMVFAQSILSIGDNEQLDYIWNSVFVSIGVTKKLVTIRTAFNSYSLLCDDTGRVSFASALIRLHEFLSNDCNNGNSVLKTATVNSSVKMTIATEETDAGDKKNIDHVMYYSDPHVG